MISHISIRNFAIIKDLNLDLYPGLNMITGETGAGKSVIIEAVSMALGSRADTDYIRTGADKAQVTIIADSASPVLPSILEELGVPADMPMVLHREISPSRSICRINGAIVPLSAMSRICRHVADIHGQYDHQALLDPENHQNVLDLYGGTAISQIKEQLSACYDQYMDASSQLAKLKRTLADSQRQKELYAYELEEIQGADIQPREDEQLTEEISVMSHSEQIHDALSMAWSRLFSDNGAGEALGAAMAKLQTVTGYSGEIDRISTVLSDAYYAVDDLNKDLRNLRDSISFSKKELDAKTERLEVIDGLKRKYGGSLEKLFAYRDKAEAALKSIENADSDMSRLESEIAKAKDAYMKLAAELTGLRKQASAMLEEKITKELTELAFHDAFFTVSIKAAAPSPSGSDNVEFMISTNKGSEVRPLAKIASGGELSRIMLAMKKIIGDLEDISTMIFDEIDTGISGATAGTVGQKLAEIAKNHQIVCITHLPQIAACGDHQFRISKDDSDDMETLFRYFNA